MKFPPRKLSDHIRTIQLVNVRADEYYESERAVVEAGEVAVPVLKGLLENRDWVVRDRASDILQKIGERRSTRGFTPPSR